jgi:hypothetical protein
MVFLDWEACQLYGVDFQQGGRMASINKVILVGNLGAAPLVSKPGTVAPSVAEDWEDAPF